MLKKQATEKELSLSDLRPGDILTFIGENTLLDNLIMRLTNHSDVSHGALYVQKDDENWILADAGQNGIHAHVLSQNFEDVNPDLGDEIREIYVSRHDSAGTAGVLPVVNIAKDYVFQDLPYPYSDLLLLGMILIYKNVTDVSLKHNVVVEFLRVLTAEVKTWIDAHRKNPAHTMVCSSYVYQCYLDASKETPKLKLNVVHGDAAPDTLPLNTLLDAYESFVNGETAYWRMNYKPEPSLLRTNNRPILEVVADLLNEESQSNVVMLPKLDLFCAMEDFLKVLMELLGKCAKSVDELIANAREQQAMFVTPNDLRYNTKNVKYLGKMKIVRKGDNYDPNLKREHLGLPFQPKACGMEAWGMEALWGT